MDETIWKTSLMNSYSSCNLQLNPSGNIMMRKQKISQKKLASTISSIMDQIKISKSSPEKKDSPKAQDPTTMVPANNRAPQLEGGHYTKNGGMWTIKHEIITSNFYELLINK